jgi:hypothetical protein
MLVKYRTPYEIKELGTEGLSNYDIAECTGRPVKVINQMVTRPSFQNLCKTNQYELVTTVTKSKSIGRPRQYVYLPVKAAKALVATANWEEGYKYLDFLLECEIAATTVLPQAMEEIKNLRAQIEALKTKALPAPKAKKALVPVWNQVLWGHPECTGYELVEATEAHSFDAAWAKNVHCNRVLRGIQKAQEHAQDVMNKGRN